MEKPYVELSVEFVNKMAAYLEQRPFREVVEFFDVLKGLKVKGLPEPVVQEQSSAE